MYNIWQDSPRGASIPRELQIYWIAADMQAPSAFPHGPSVRHTTQTQRERERERELRNYAVLRRGANADSINV